MINFNKKDAVADTIKTILKQEGVDVNDRTEDKLAGRTKVKKKDDVGPSGDFKSTKVKVTAEEIESVDESLKGGQTELDKNHNGKLDSQDFKILRGKKSLKKFKEDHDANSVIDQMINEVLSKDASAGAWIKDFVNSDNPKFAGKSAAKRKEMALGAYYKKQNEETEQLDESLYGTRTTNVLNRSHELYNKSRSETDPAKKTALVNQSTKAHKVFSKLRDREIAKDPEGHARKMQSGATQDFKDQEARRGIGHVRDHVEVDGQAMQESNWDKMLADVKAKRGPQPSGGSGVKQGTRYGGGKQTSKPEQDEDDKKKVTEGKQPLDNVPFDPPYNTTSTAEVTDKSGAKHTPMSRVKHLARTAMKKVKKDLGKK